MAWKASGVTSRPVTPVPPVEITTSMAGSSIQVMSWAVIDGMSSLTMARAAKRWPSAVSRSTSVLPDLSSASIRVSETVRTAILTARNGRDSSIFAIGGYLLIGPLICNIGVHCHINRPAASRNGLQRWGGLAQTLLIDPVVGQH